MYGTSEIDRRRARAVNIGVDDHYRLSRRVDDLANRTGMLETLAVQHSEDSFNLRESVTGTVEQNTKAVENLKAWMAGEFGKFENWITAHDLKSFKQETLFSAALMVNTITILAAITVIARHW